MKIIKTQWLCTLLLLLAAPAWAEDKMESGLNQVHLLELFSTQSCSSCPPAQEWVNQLNNKPGLWEKFIPVVFHVDYWDYLGWKDPYSKKEFTLRQKMYYQQAATRAVYTPMFSLDGSEWRSRSASSTLAISGKEVGNLIVQSKGRYSYQVEFKPKDLSQSGYKVYAALLGKGISTEVKGGENSGRTIKHDFLVLELQKRKLSNLKTLVRFKNTKRPELKNAAVAVWVTNADQLSPLQAVGGPIKPGGGQLKH